MISAQPTYSVRLDRANKKIIVNVVQDVEPYLKEAKRFRDAMPRTLDRKRWAEREFTLPNVLIERFYNQGLNWFDKNDRARIRRIIMTDPDYKALRTVRARPLARHQIIPDWAKRSASWESIGALRAAADQSKAAALTRDSRIVLPSTGTR